jgi:hypothetical protein
MGANREPCGISCHFSRLLLVFPFSTSPLGTAKHGPRQTDRSRAWLSRRSGSILPPHPLLMFGRYRSPPPFPNLDYACRDKSLRALRWKGCRAKRLPLLNVCNRMMESICVAPNGDISEFDVLALPNLLPSCCQHQPLEGDIPWAGP